MALELVPAKPEHVPELGRILYEAFKDISDRHGFPPDAGSVGFGRMVTGMMVQQEEIFGVAAMRTVRLWAQTSFWPATRWEAWAR